MASVARIFAEPGADVLDVAVIGAKILDPKFVDGRIVDGRIIGGRVVDTHHLGQKTLHALHLDAEHRRTEIIAIIGFGLALLMMYVL